MHTSPGKSDRTTRRQITETQCKDTGMAAVLICLLVALWAQNQVAVAIAVVLLVVDMTVPALFRPAAVVWLGLSEILGTVVSKILLTLIFFSLVTSVGMARRFSGADPLQLKQWKAGSRSVFKVRDHRFSAADIEKPY